MLRLALHWQILIAIVLAVFAGWLTGAEGSLFGIHFVVIYDFLGDIFLSALKMIIVPLVMSSIIIGVVGIGGHHSLARLGWKTILFYLGSSLLAIVVGLILVNITQPGLIDGHPAGEQLHLHADADELDEVLARAEGGSSSILDLFKRMVPSNVIAAAAEGSMLGLIFFSLVFGFFMTRVDKEKGQTLISFWQGVSEVMMLMTMWVMRFAPLGVFGLVAETIAETGFGAFKPMLMFFITVVLALLFHMLVTMSVLLRLLGKVSPVRYFKHLSPVLLTAFSTASSAATLPMTMETLEKDVGVSNGTTSFVLPLGATINMDGTALYECVAAMFIAQAYGLDLTFLQQFTIVFTALITSIGVAGVPAASLVAIAVILGVMGLPLDGIALLMVTDRVLDMMRTAVNVYGDSCAAVIIARTEGEETTVACR